jgi:PadR family transcriptional regulator PadR
LSPEPVADAYDLPDPRLGIASSGHPAAGIAKPDYSRVILRLAMHIAVFRQPGNFRLITDGLRRTLGSVTEGKVMCKPADLVQGTLDLLLLKILALQPLHAWAISQRLKQISGDVLQGSDGSLYPSLHKLEQEGWITAEWKVTDNGRRAKFYALTRPGRRALEREPGNWERLSGAISRVVRLNEV